ncbi:MAG TPA: hypothetical protein VLN58_16270 [Verrucomicrobiae bacterium]|nr:hypothetical protein [Verrucomicrobiae bacterium]
MFKSLIVSALRMFFTRGAGAACLVATFSLWLSGCAALQVHVLQTKVYLNKVPATSIAASFPKGPGIAPGDKLPLVVTFTTADGKVFVTEGQGHGKILWQDLNVSATVATVNNKGVLSLPSDPRFSEGKLPHVTITAPSHPDLKAELDIPIRYDSKFAATFAGSSGSNGLDGNSGIDGTSGSMGSIDPDHPEAGGDGSDGTNGTDGQNGGNGSDGPPIKVRVTLRQGSQTPLLQIGVQAERKTTMFLVDPQGGSLTVKSVGGDGGQGGKGGRGGRGGSGGVGTPNGRDGRDGSNGSDGLSGFSGHGGSITVIYDPEAAPYLGAIRLPKSDGPKPIFREELVPQLW